MTRVTEPANPESAPVIKGARPRDAKAAAALDRYDGRARLPLVLSAVLPLVVAPETGHPVSIAIGIVSWLVFVVDFAVHARYIDRYIGTHLGQFDLAIVILTAPWFLLPGAVQGGGIIVVLRLARLARLVVASKKARLLFSRVGRVAIVAGSVMIVGAMVAYYAEHPTNDEFATFGDSIWWAIVTLTTVGYGDIVPETTTGRIVAVMIMLTGVAVLGLLAGTLASFFRLQPNQSAAPSDPPATVDPAAGDAAAPAGRGLAAEPGTGVDQILRELAELRAQVGQLTSTRAENAGAAAHLGHPEPAGGSRAGPGDEAR